MPAGPDSRPWRRFLRFSVRELIVLVLVVGSRCLGWIVRGGTNPAPCGSGDHESWRYRLNMTWKRSAGHQPRRGKPTAPEWLVNLVGVDYFDHVTIVWGGRPNRRNVRTDRAS